jgi:hypothetical protein
MNTREANNYSHSTSPSPDKARWRLNTTIRFPTQENQSSDTNVSTDAAYDVCASVPHHHHTSQFTRACKVFNFEHVNTADNFTIINISKFVQATPHECAPASDILPRCPALVGAALQGSIQ